LKIDRAFLNRCSPSAIGGLGEAALNQLLHPAQALEHPLEVVNDPDLIAKRKTV
jgi:hypothetical protein